MSIQISYDELAKLGEGIAHFHKAREYADRMMLDAEGEDEKALAKVAMEEVDKLRDQFHYNITESSNILKEQYEIDLGAIMLARIWILEAMMSVDEDDGLDEDEEVAYELRHLKIVKEFMNGF